MAGYLPAIVLSLLGPTRNTSSNRSVKAPAREIGTLARPPTSTGEPKTSSCEELVTTQSQGLNLSPGENRPSPGFACTHCTEPRVFKTARGLGQHVAKVHPVQRDLKITAALNARKRVSVSDAEIDLVAEMELEFGHTAASGTAGRGINQIIHNEMAKKFPDHRITVERIKNLRKSDKYKLVLDQHRKSQPVIMTPKDGVDKDRVENKSPPTGYGGYGANQNNQDVNQPEIPESPGMEPVERQAPFDPDHSSSSESSSSESEATSEDEADDEVQNDTGLEAIRKIEEKLETLDAAWTGFTPAQLCRLRPEQIDSVANKALAFCEAKLAYPKRKVYPTPRGEGQMNRRRRRARRRAATMRLYEQSPATCFKKILSGTIESNFGNVSREANVAYWKELNEQESEYRAFETTTKPKDHSLANPVTIAEVNEISKKLKQSAPAGDGVDRLCFRRAPKEVWAVLYNVFLANGYVPNELKVGSITLVPKVDVPDSPSQFRPISVFSLVLRVFHSILDRRLTGNVELKATQKGFITRNGMAENLFVVKQILKKLRHSKNSLHCVFLDVSKAFDSVSHRAIRAALERVGVPELLVNYIQSLYADSTADLYGQRIGVKRGIRQGDPLSNFIFKAILDMALDGLPEGWGYPVPGGGRVSDLFFADDGVLLSNSHLNAQRILDFVAERFGRVGLKIHPGKTVSMSVEYNGRTKQHFCNAERKFRVEGATVNALASDGKIKYLGVYVTPKGILPTKGLEDLDTLINRLNRSALDARQKLEALKTSVLPAFVHGLTNSGVTKALLSSFDRKVRAGVRKILHLPSDTHRSVFHLPVKCGGMGIMSFLTQIPYLTQRLHKALTESPCRLVRAHVSESRGPRLVKVNGEIIISKSAAVEAWAKGFRDSWDQKELLDRDQCLESRLRRWVGGSEQGVFPKRFIKAIHTRFQLLATPLRRHRRDPAVAKRCRLDTMVASLGHISQGCALVHGLRVRRHDRVVETLEKSLRSNGWTVLKEPRIPHGGTFLKPDLVALNKGQSFVLDPTIVSDGADLRVKGLEKKYLYDCPSVREFVSEYRRNAGMPEAPMNVSGISITFRGDVSKEHVQILRGMGVSMKTLMLMMIDVLTDTWGLWHTWLKSPLAVG